MLSWFPIENVNEKKEEMELPQSRWMRDDRIVTCPKPPEGHRLWQVKDERGGGYRWWVVAMPQDFVPSEQIEMVPECAFELHYFETRAHWQKRSEEKS